MGICLLIDFGSTFTKVAAVDLDQEVLLARVQAPSTVTTDITIGLRRALEVLAEKVPSWEKATHKLACSSAAGGLKMVVVGLIPDLTSEAARRAALGAGAKVVGVYSSELSLRELKAITDLGPDIVLLAGGTDGGNTEVILNNARLIAHSNLEVPVVIAGNKVADDEAESIFSRAGKVVWVTENVMPELGKLNVEPARSVIREIFIRRIVESKGLKKAEEFIQGIIMPTPEAVLSAARLLAYGTSVEEGIGELMVVDVGGATTDVHTVAKGDPVHEGLVLKGLPEPIVKRTVEGDLGVRHNILHIVEAVGERKISGEAGLSETDLKRIATHWSREVERVPNSPEDVSLDRVLAGAAVEIAVKRHVGHVQVIYSPVGPVSLLYGKDLRSLPNLIATGGPLAFSNKAGLILKKALYRAEEPDILRPVRPRLFIDWSYVLFAFGLLGEVDAHATVRMMKKYIEPVATESDVSACV